MVARKILGGSGLGGTDSEAIHVWLMKFRENGTRLRTSVIKLLWTGKPMGFHPRRPTVNLCQAV